MRADEFAHAVGTARGWTNLETWALNRALDLWLSGDRGLDEMTRERVAQAVAGSAGARPGLAGIAIQNLWSELTDPGNGLMPARDILAMTEGVGSVSRVNWDELGRRWLDSLDDDS